MPPLTLRPRHLFLAAALLLPLALACGGGGTTDPDPGPGPGPGPGPEPAPVAVVSVTPDNALVVVDDAGQLTAQTADSDGTVLTGRAVTWSSLDENLATVSSSGAVSAISYGDARIVATSEGKSDTVTIRARLRFTQISTGEVLTCGLLPSGAAWCWGLNLNGLLGARLDVDRSTIPVRVADGHRFTTITVGGYHACGLDQDLAAWCWGSGKNGELGNGIAGEIVSSFPDRVAGNHRFVAISAGALNTCALDESLLAYCWGTASTGRIPGRTQDAPFPVALPAPDTPQPLTYESIQVGSSHTCGLATQIDGGGLWCWGDNQYGQIVDSPDPIYTQLGTPLIPATYGVGVGFTCYTGNDAETLGPVAECRGRDFTTTNNASATRDFPSVLAAVAMDAGHSTACVLLPGGDLRCWGANGFGELGIGAQSAPVAVPVAPLGGHSWTAMDMGNSYMCGITTDGITYCWGYNSDGSLGDGTEMARTEPTPVAGQL